MATNKTIRVIELLVNTSTTTTSNPIELDYRFGPGVPTRSFFFNKAAATGPSIYVEAAPTTAGPWIPFVEVTAACTATLVQSYINAPLIRLSYAGGGPATSIYFVV